MKSQLIATLKTLPSEWSVCPVGIKKNPINTDWQKGISRGELIEILNNGYNGIDKGGKPYYVAASKITGLGLITGELSGHLIAIDCDGHTAHKLAESLGGLPKTVSWTSGKEGRAQYLYLIPEMYRNTLKNFTRKVLETGQDEQLEFRVNGCQSVLWSSKHPDTSGYTKINSIENTPIVECPTWVIEQILKDENKTSTDVNQSKLNQQSPIPLFQCLSIEHRNNIKSGLGFNCSRNPMGFKITVDALGCESRLQYLGIPYTGTAKELLEEFHSNSDKKEFTQNDVETIYKSASKSNPTPCLDDDKLKNCYKAFLKNQRQQSTNITSKSNNQTSGNTVMKPEPESNVVPFKASQQQSNIIDDIEQEFKDLSEQNLSKSKHQLKINEIAKKYNINPKEISEVYKNYLSEIEDENYQDDIKSDLDSFLNNKIQLLDTSRYLPGNLNKITELATRLCLRPELALTIFYTTISSLLKVGTMIDLSEYTSFDQPMGIYSAIVAEPSQRKSPLINAIATKPLREILKKRKDDYIEEMKQYAFELKYFEDDKSGNVPEPIKPTMRHYYVNSGTGAGMRDLINEQAKKSWGITLLADEISGWFKSQNQSYNIGQKEDFLSYYDGFGKRDALKGGLASDFEECLVSVLGGIQPNVFKEFNDGSDDNGAHARFNFVNQPSVPFIIPDDPQGSLDLLPLLSGVYEKISELPQLILKLSPEAKKHFDGLNNKCEMYRVNAKSLALAALWGKMPGKIGRFAALIHVVEQLSQGNGDIDPVVGKETLTKAANLAKFYYKEAENIYASCEQGNLSPVLANILEIAKDAPTSITARDVMRNKIMRTKDFKSLKSADIQNIFVQLADMGYGTIIGSGIKLHFQFCHGLSQVVTTTCDTLKSIQYSDSSHLSQLSQEKNNFLENGATSTIILDENPDIQKKLVTVVTNTLKPILDEGLGLSQVAVTNRDSCDKISDFDENDVIVYTKNENDVIVYTKNETCDKIGDKTDDVIIYTCDKIGDKNDSYSGGRSPYPPIDFDLLVEGDVIFDVGCKLYTLKSLTVEGWECTNGSYVTKSNIHAFHHAPKSGWV